jgi:hypothetical protein
MDTTLNQQQTTPRHVLLTRADDEVGHAYQEIKRADEELARAHEKLLKLERDAVPGNRSLFDRPAVRGLTGLLLAVCIGVAAIGWQSSYGDVAKEIVGRWVPQRVVTSPPPLENTGLTAQPSPPTVQAVVEKTTSPQPPLLAQAAPEDVAPTAAATLSPELTQLLQSMARDLATLRQGIEQIKASQEQLARDNAHAAEQLKATQEQMARVIAKPPEAKPSPAKPSQAKTSEAKTSEAKASDAKPSQQNPRPRISAPPTRPTATPMRKPAPAP